MLILIVYLLLPKHEIWKSHNSHSVPWCTTSFVDAWSGTWNLPDATGAVIQYTDIFKGSVIYHFMLSFFQYFNFHLTYIYIKKKKNL